MADMKAANKALNKAKIALMAKPDSVFFSTVCFSLKHVWDDRIPTAGTDGVSVLYNPDFFLSLSEDVRTFVVLHETLHVAFMHPVRVGALDKQKYNTAADYVINDVCKKAGFTLWDQALWDAQYRDMSTGQVYELLPDKPPGQGNPMAGDIMEPGSQSKGGEDGKSGSDPGDAVARAKEVADEIDDILIRASVASKMSGDKPGSIPGELEVYLDKLLNPKLPWQRILQKWMSQVAKADYSWRKPNRRFFPRHYLPSLYSEGLGVIAMATDTSCSVSDQGFTSYFAEIHSVLKQLKPTRLDLLHFDTSIKQIDQIRSVQDLNRVKFTGRGGTDIWPVIEWAAKNRPQVLIIFTDGYFNHQPVDPKVPILWIINDNPGFTAPYGKVIHIDT